VQTLRREDSLTKLIEQQRENPVVVLHWYDFICPFCYVGQQRTNILVRNGFSVIELPFRAHPEIPAQGVQMGPRRGAMYDNLEREAVEAGLELNWPARLPNSSIALAAAEWVRESQPNDFAGFHEDLFAAHFVQGEDLGDHAVVERYAARRGVNVKELREALSDRSALSAVEQSEEIARSYGVHGTPAWLVAGRLVSGLLPAESFERMVAHAAH
jgi:predicted DsbA family dithiol-disulfide isomerase